MFIRKDSVVEKYLFWEWKAIGLLELRIWVGYGRRGDLKSRLGSYFRGLPVPGTGLDSIGIGYHKMSVQTMAVL